MSKPKPRDVLLRQSMVGTFDVIDAITAQHIAGPVEASQAIQLARAYGADAVWQQTLDERGRPLGDPARIPLW